MQTQEYLCLDNKNKFFLSVILSFVLPTELKWLYLQIYKWNIPLPLPCPSFSLLSPYTRTKKPHLFYKFWNTLGSSCLLQKLLEHLAAEITSSDKLPDGAQQHPPAAPDTTRRREKPFCRVQAGRKGVGVRSRLYWLSKRYIQEGCYLQYSSENHPRGRARNQHSYIIGWA